MPEIALRQATVEDMPSVAHLHRLAFFSAMPLMPVLHTPQEDVAFYTTIVFPRTEIWLAEEDDRTIGFIAFRPGWVDHLYLHPDHHGRHLGTALLAQAQAANDSLRLWTFQCNLGARRFYERHHFRVERETDGSENEERQPDVLYFWTRV